MNKVINVHLVNDSVWFDSMICFLKSKYELITIESLHEFYLGRINMKNSCHITVDDGDKSFYDAIFPVLKKYNVPASVYVSPKMCKEKSNYWFQEVTGYNQIELKRIIADMLNIPFNFLKKYNTDSILKTRPIYQIHEIIKRYRKMTRTPKKAFQNMSVKNLKEVDQSGLVTIGAHSMSHPILRNEEDANSKHEINESVCELSTLLEREIKYFAYPNGIPMLDFTEREEGYLRNIGIQLAFTAEAESISSIENPLCIPRVGVSNREAMVKVGTKLALGSFWNAFRRVKPGGEYRERQELSKILPQGMLREEK